jgi:hypothetical protein
VRLSITLKLNRIRIVSGLAAALLFIGGFAFGFVACLHLKSAASKDIRAEYLRHAGNAPPSVRSGVLTTLRAFQAGYIKRDPKDLDSFTSRLIAKSDDVLILGTDAGEWVRGYSATAAFIRADWQGWGDVRFNVDDSIISSFGDVAWVASTGEVHFKGFNRPVRFSGVLIRDGNNWLFRQIQFQWDDRDPSSTDIFRPRTYLKLVELAFRRISGSAS